MMPLSNVTIASDGAGFGSHVLVDGFPIKGVIAVSVDIDAGDIVRTRIDVIGAATGAPYPYDAATPIYDQLAAERDA